MTTDSSAAGIRLLHLSAAQNERLRRACAGDAEAAASFDTELVREPVRLLVEVISTKSVPAGSGVSYGHTYVTTTETVLARVAIGYGHGLPRKAGNRASVTWRATGQMPVRLPIVGRVAMDEFVVDVGSTPVAAGDRVVVFGDAANGEIPLEQWAASIGEPPVAVAACFDARTRRVISA
ncbi:alanine racemase C-terminal domain-containing protein [Paramicrobacterium humi]|uniref:alanine racemase C-terminal domain-containing protein n=1 Tax=Paramicrobacterium humi TaxID=640635 RepID=UPI000A8A313C|nr:alanine racemase C-terminal domain-containing protein [Microbacterium humi]